MKEKKTNRFLSKVDGYFGISESGSSFRTEIVAGLTTFMAMVYALLVVPGMHPADQVSFGAVYIATALGAIVGTMLMALVAKMPLAQASGLGATAYVTGTLLGGNMGLTYANTMVFVLLGGAIFVLLTATGLRKQILAGIPDEIKTIVPVGIGMFIAFIGFKKAGLVVLHEDSIGFASFNVLGGVDYSGAIGAAVALCGAIAIAVLTKRNVKGGILWGCSAVRRSIMRSWGWAVSGTRGAVRSFKTSRRASKIPSRRLPHGGRNRRGRSSSTGSTSAGSAQASL